MYVIASREVRQIPVGVLGAFPSFWLQRFHLAISRAIGWNFFNSRERSLGNGHMYYESFNFSGEHTCITICSNSEVQKRSKAETGEGAPIVKCASLGCLNIQLG